MNQVFKLESGKVLFFEGSEIVQFNLNQEAFLGIYHAGEAVGACVKLSNLYEEANISNLKWVIQQVVAVVRDTNIKIQAKLVGPTSLLILLNKILQSSIIEVVSSKEIKGGAVEGYFYPSTGRLKVSFIDDYQDSYLLENKKSRDKNIS